MKKLKEQQIRKEWHKFFIRNKHLFTNDETLARKNKKLIYIKNENQVAKRRFPQDFTLFQYQGSWEDIY